jgi:hypothetical protein
MLVKFTQNNLPYAVGEVANFDDEKAQQLIGARVAEKFVEEAEPAAVAAGEVEKDAAPTKKAGSRKPEAGS